ncbi:MAG: patatin-like phospholipase family protein, partial [Pseudoxanthomonas sp.]
ISLRDEIINDRHRSLLDGLDVAPRMTETTARLRRALDDVDQVVAKRRVRRTPRRLKSTG